MPFIHLHVGDKGVVKPCCVANIHLGNINSQSINEIWNGEEINTLRDQFNKGIPDKRCFVCINREKGNTKSLRQETFEKFPKASVLNPKPIYFDIRFSNVCNFKCRTCWHGASSKWFEDAKKLKREAHHKAIIKNVEEYTKFIEQAGEFLLEAEEIYFAGGEPLVTEEHYLLLQYLIQHKKEDIRLRYNTNFSTLTFKHHHVLNLWQHFHYVEIMASIDDEGANGERIRNGFNWEQFLKNRSRIREIPHIQFQISPTVSILNVGQLPHFYKNLVTNKIIESHEFYINILERPYHYNIQALPTDKKLKIQEEYSLFMKDLANDKMNNDIIDQFKGIISFMKSKNLESKYWDIYHKEEQKIDHLWA